MTRTQTVSLKEGLSGRSSGDAGMATGAGAKIFGMARGARKARELVAEKEHIPWRGISPARGEMEDLRGNSPRSTGERPGAADAEGGLDRFPTEEEIAASSGS